MLVLLLSADLMTQSKVSSAALAVGLTFQAVPTAARLAAACVVPAIVVLDLATQGYELQGVVEQLKLLATPPKAILAFGPHVHEARLKSAADAGCNGVFARGQFFGQATEILRQYL